MENSVKSLVLTGASSGLGLEAVKQLVAQPGQRWNIIAGVRDTERTRKAFDDLEFDAERHTLTILHLELSDLKGVKAFASQTLKALGEKPLDYLLLNAAISDGAEEPGPYGSKWSKSYLVNHLAHHYLVHLLREKLVLSQGRVIFVSSGAHRDLEDPNELENMLKGGSGVPGMKLYPAAKFVQLLGAHWWNRQLAGQATVIVTSPGPVPGTNIGKGAGLTLTWALPNAKSIPDGAGIIIRALTKDDFPDDPEQIYWTGTGGWISKDQYARTLDRDMQNKWCPSQEAIEKDEGILS